jgi:sporulation protein YlmC with PRC-barrel domain
MAAGTLEGDDVVNDAGDKLGTLYEIMLDAPSGRIAYAVLSSGGFIRITGLAATGSDRPSTDCSNS